jgi:lipopolysaccharide export system permease protein
MSVPLAALAGAMMTFGRLAQDNEIMALRSGGVRLFSIFLPVLGFTFLLAVAMVFFNLFVLPESNHRVRNLLSDVSSKKPTVRLEEGEFNDEFPGYSIYIGRKDDRTSRIYDVKISIKSRRGHSFIFSPEGTIDVTPDETYMQMVLYSSEVHEQIDNNYRRIFTDTQTINLPLNTDLIRRERTHRSEREMTLPMLVENIGKQEEKLVEYEEALVRAPNKVKRKEYESRIEGVNKKINGMKVEIHKSIAFALAGIIFLCFGSALGGKLRKGGIGLAIVLSLVFFAFYYVLLIGGESLAKNGKITAWLAMWIPNFIFLPFTAEVFGEVFFESSLVLWRLRR